MAKYNTHSANTIALTVVFGAASVLAVILRFVARSRTKAHYAADDWFALAGMITLLIWMGVLIYGKFDNLRNLSLKLTICVVAENGSGYNPAILPKPVLVNYLKVGLTYIVMCVTHKS